MCLWLLILVLVPIQAFGHTKLIEMNPQPDSQIELSPEHVHLQFSAKLEAVSGQTLYVEDEAGENIEAGPVQIGEDSKSVQLTLPQLQKGTYTVHYHVMSLDGHMVMGDYQFTVLANHEQAETEAPAGEHAEHEAPAEEHIDPEAPSETHV